MILMGYGWFDDGLSREDEFDGLSMEDALCRSILHT